MDIIDDILLNKVSQEALESKRKRKNYNFHTSFEDPVNRMLNALEPGTYVPPHNHSDPDKREVFLILTGQCAVIYFDDEGAITDGTILDRDKGVYGIEVPPGRWHTVVALEAGTVVYELKDGPYIPVKDKNRASWAPAEDSSDSSEYLKLLENYIYDHLM
ncbi:WbuC family cupin fold metalloprotein [Marinilabiliaceae bacterium ANBcel2]|nr:WbuC family cupin fold metalloprotein [Marinilabiliaceae bacterium ANBcel2]